MRAAQLIIQIVLARSLIPSDYSQFFFYWTTVLGLSVFIGDSFGIVMSRELSLRVGTNLEPMLRKALGLAIIVSLIPFILILMKLYLIPMNVVDSIHPFFIAFIGFVLAFQSALQNIVIGLNQTRSLTVSQFIASLVLMLSVLWTAKGMHWTTILSLLVFVHVINCVTLVMISWFQVKIKSRDSTKTTELAFNWKSALKAASTLALAAVLGAPVHVICISLLRASDFEFLTTEVGTFGVGYILYSLCSFLPGTAAFLLTPKLIQSKNPVVHKEYLKNIDRFLPIGFFCVVIFALVLYFAPSAILEVQAHYKIPMVLLALAGTLAGASSLFVAGLNAHFQTHLVLKNMIVHAIGYLVCTLILVYWLNFGATGLAGALLCASVLHYSSLRVSYHFKIVK